MTTFIPIQEFSGSNSHLHRGSNIPWGEGNVRGILLPEVLDVSSLSFRFLIECHLPDPLDVIGTPWGGPGKLLDACRILSQCIQGSHSLPPSVSPAHKWIKDQGAVWRNPCPPALDEYCIILDVLPAALVSKWPLFSPQLGKLS